MDFKNLFQKTIHHFPREIDISDGVRLEKTSGFRSVNLSSAWHMAESLAENEWEALLVWVVYGYLHKRAKQLHGTEAYKQIVIESEIDLTDLEEMYLEALRVEGYEDMLIEYLDGNISKSI